MSAGFDITSTHRAEIVENPTVGTSVRSYWQTPGRVTSVREMRGEDLDRWAVFDHGQVLIRIEWDGGHSDEAPQSHMEWVRVVN